MLYLLLNASAYFCAKVITECRDRPSKTRRIVSCIRASDVNKDWTCKDKDKDQAYKDQDKDKD